MNQEEKVLRQSIRQLIRHVKQKKLNEETQFKSLLNKLMEHELKQMLSEATTPDVDPAPNKSTGINVLEDENLRQGIKDFSDWPTIPQLYVKKEFVGGFYIVKEMFENGELKKLFEDKQIKYKINKKFILVQIVPNQIHLNYQSHLTQIF